MIYDRHLVLQSIWAKAFRAQVYYVERAGNIIDEVVQEYIKEQAEESMREDKTVPLCRRPGNMLVAVLPFERGADRL